MKIAYCFTLFVLFVGIGLAACSQPAAQPDPQAAKPSKPGGTGPALALKGDATQGASIFSNKCSDCHGDNGQGGVQNPGAKDGTVPALNPINTSLFNSDEKVFAANLDLFIEHGSLPVGDHPVRMMLGYGDNGVLQP